MKGRFAGTSLVPNGSVHLLVRATSPGCIRMTWISPSPLGAMEMASTDRFLVDQRVTRNPERYVCSRSTRSAGAPTP